MLKIQSMIHWLEGNEKNFKLMKLLVSGHRRKKLDDNNYDKNFIRGSIDEILLEIKTLGIPFIGYVGMADGVDLMFCESCNALELPYIACIPFDEQDQYMLDCDKWVRTEMINGAKEIKKVKNSWMVEHCDIAICVWDGNKGGTHNVIQQLIEKRIDFYWINPVSNVMWKCFKQ